MEDKKASPIDTNNLYFLAKQIEDSGYWKIALLPNEYERLLPLLESELDFNNFMTINHNVEFQKSSNKDDYESLIDKTPNMSEFYFNASIDNIALKDVEDDVLFQFRIRSIISEYLIKTVLYPNQTPIKDIKDKLKKKEKDLIRKKNSMNANLSMPMDDIIYSLELDENDWNNRDEIRDLYLKNNNVILKFINI
jgi:hypothetical protein